MVAKSRTPGPYRAEFGAVYRDGLGAGFVFTVDPPAFAEDVADALNFQVAANTKAEECNDG